MKKVLWLCSWYPHSQEPFEGDFIQRHAQAASAYAAITVIKVVSKGVVTKTETKLSFFNRFPNLEERVVCLAKKHRMVERYVNFFLWFKIFKREVKKYIAERGRPDLVHVHIPYKAGLIAMWIKRKYAIPYVVTEHWGIYNDVVKDNYRRKSFFFQRVVKRVLSHAEALHSVSDYLGKKINESVISIPYMVIPNVVDVSLFSVKEKLYNESSFRLLHISNGAIEKNLDGICESFMKLDHAVFQLKVVGLPQDKNDIYAARYPQISFVGIVSYLSIASIIQQADCLLMFSYIENSPCVIGESLCCGVPVIATRVGGIPELINIKNGVLVCPDDRTDLCRSIKKIRLMQDKYNPVQIAETAQLKLSYETVGEQMGKWYDSIISGTNA